MGKIEDAIARLGADLEKGAEQWRDEFRAGFSQFANGVRLQGCRVLPLRGALLYGGPGRLVGWSLRNDHATEAAVITLRDGRSNDDDVAPPVAVLTIAAGDTSNLTVPGASITEALWLQQDGGTLVGAVYLGAVD